ncbi:MAG: hypothetical protein ACRDY1_15445, partial [Acidimicrobiales bacterium]
MTDAEDLRLDGVVVSGTTPDGPTAVTGLSLVLDARGMTVIVPGGGEPRTAPWSSISVPKFRSTATLPDGTPATALAVQAGGRPLEFLVPTHTLPTDMAPTLEAKVTALATRYGAASAVASASAPTAPTTAPTTSIPPTPPAPTPPTPPAPTPPT